MNRYLISISLGPVQSLIGAARRTRDLWCGSWLLNEAAKAAAKELHDAQPGCLIFPCPEDPKELEPSTQIRDDDANISNIIRAEIEAMTPDTARTLVGQAKAAAQARISELCDAARNELGGLPFHDELWNVQKQDILEVFGAWVPISEESSPYPSASNRLGALLAARKATRDFTVSASTPEGLGYGIPKSSLDGARESVINLQHKNRAVRAFRSAIRKLGLGQGEELDALAVTKRMAGKIDQFTAYSRIAADSWIESLDETQQERIRQAYEPLVSYQLATRVGGNGGIYNPLPFDAQLVFEFRLESALTRKDMDPTERDDLEALRKILRTIPEKPVPYAVILQADGDRMGELLSQAQTAEHSRQISRALHGFARSVRSIVRRHRGHAIYAGGDDVLAMLPLDNAIACAQALASSFAESLRPVASELGLPASDQPTLSVGLGIGHIVEPLGAARQRASEAEALAKGNGEKSPRNALAIKLDVRSGGEISWRTNWDDITGLSTLEYLSAQYRLQTCPSRLGYEIRDIAQRLAWATHNSPHSPLPGIHAAEMQRTLDSARQRYGKNTLPHEFQEYLHNRARQVGLARLADELIITRWLSSRTQSDIGALQ